MLETLKSKDELMRSFKNLRLIYKAKQAEIKTKEEDAQYEKNKKLVETTAIYTAENIVKDLANLHIDFNKSIEELGVQLENEVNKLNDLKSSITVANLQLLEVSNTKIAADALHILKLEQEAQNKIFEENKINQLKNIDTEKTNTLIFWEKEQKEFDSMVLERTEKLKNEREKELADYKYELENSYKIEADQFTEKKKNLERELRDIDFKKNKDWNNREKFLTQNQAKFDEYKNKIDNADNEIQEATKKAREEAIKNASREAKIRSELWEKEMDGAKQVYELQIQTLENSIEKNTSHLEKLQIELKDALTQVQSLSVKAMK
ncbi:MAG: hypothetical protein EAZ85_11580 [Bacteroidetes bacterium]|nr:MAG: hypothetical protein EAZ85_11580 [Bacteroidota bacterium]TAG87609.1 MAG: hypothetical protein EAZ20_10240 [Bacteroidota bacterium]